MPRSAATALRGHLDPKLKVWLTWDGTFLMGPRYLRFLAAVDKTGTIRAAGREVGWSYRTCLNRIRRMEHVLGSPVLMTTRGGRGGGGARLSTVARRLVRVFAPWQRDVVRSSNRVFRVALSR